MIKTILNKISLLSENNKIICYNILGAFIVKGASLVLSLFTMPAYFAFFNNQVTLGMWFTLLSVLNWIMTFDLGIGNGLRNHLTKALTQKNTNAVKRYISSAYIAIGVLSVVIFIAFNLFLNYVNWNKVFNIEINIVSQNALQNAIAIVFLGIIIQFFLRIISSVLYALQGSALNNFMSLCTSILILISVCIIPSGTNDQNLVTMAWVNTIAVLLPLIICTLIIFCGKLKKMRPSFRYFSMSYAKDVLSLGSAFFFVQIVYMIIMCTNEYTITMFSGNEFVVEYQVYNKLFTLGSTVFTLALTPIWSAVTKALNEKKYMWIDSLYNKLLIMAGVGCLCEFLIIPFLQVVINIWLGDDSIIVNYFYAIMFALMGSVMIFNGVLSSVANGVGELKSQAIFFGIGAIVKIPLSWMLVQITGSWIGIVIATLISMLMYCIVQPFWLKKYLQNKIIKEQN